MRSPLVEMSPALITGLQTFASSGQGVRLVVPGRFPGLVCLCNSKLRTIHCFSRLAAFCLPLSISITLIDLLFAGFSAPGPEYFRQCAVPPASPDLLIKLELLGPRAPMWGQGGIRRVSRPHAAVQPLSYNPGRNQPTGALKLLWCRWARLPILLSDL